MMRRKVATAIKTPEDQLQLLASQLALTRHAPQHPSTLHVKEELALTCKAL
jgi:hypothetical protein